MATLGVLFGGSWVATRGNGSQAQNTPPINAGSKDEENFIQYAVSRIPPHLSKVGLTVVQGIPTAGRTGGQE